MAMVERVVHGAPPPHAFVRRPGHHEDVFIAQLSAELGELKQRQADFAMLMDVYKQLEGKYHDAVLEVQTMQVECSGRIEQDRYEVGNMVRELELVRAENVTAEDDQMAILDSIAVVERDVYSACRELNDLRVQCTQVDLANMDAKKQIDYQEQHKCDCQNASMAQIEKIKELADAQSALTLECVEAQKRLEALGMDHRVNDESIRKSCDLLQMTNDKL